MAPQRISGGTECRKPLIFMHFHEVFLGSQHEVWSKQHNGKVSLFRSLIVLAGGVANIPLDAVYPTLHGNPDDFDGDHTYKLTFMPPSSPSPGPCTPDAPFPVTGIYPPMVSDNSGNPKGFWSIHVYATDPTESAAPFIAQTSVLNTSYSTADTPVLSVDAAANTMTVSAPNWGTIISSTPILFGENA